MSNRKVSSKIISFTHVYNMTSACLSLSLSLWQAQTRQAWSCRHRAVVRRRVTTLGRTRSGDASTDAIVAGDIKSVKASHKASVKRIL